MPLIQTDSQHYSDIADAIRDMSGNEETFYPSEMAAGVRSIPQTIAIQPIIYSLEEREVGVWTDGKPLYQKTWDFGSNKTIPAKDSWFDTEIDGSYIDKVVLCCGYRNDTNFVGIIACGVNQSNHIVLMQGRNISLDSFRGFTVQYTKTTDTPGSGTWTPSGVPAHHYSTEEQVIGTWVDGKPLYEKTLYIARIPVNDYNTYDIANNINKVIFVEGMLDFRPIHYNRPDNPNAESCIQITTVDNQKKLWIRTYREFESDAYITIRYTKTTD